ncbi:MAG: MaoC/PaaZ C-terminal domain-containing protein [Planctomycetota bacterium]
MSESLQSAWPRGAPAVGQRAERARDIELFTEISGDKNPLHYDEAAASASQMGGIVVQGGITSAPAF